MKLSANENSLVSCEILLIINKIQQGKGQTESMFQSFIKKMYRIMFLRKKNNINLWPITNSKLRRNGIHN